MIRTFLYGVSVALFTVLAVDIYQSIYVQPHKDYRTVAAALMIRNEQHTLNLTLASIRGLGITDVYLYDTGSTDRTKFVAESANKTGDMTVHWLEGEFVDFATSRNVLLRWAQNKTDWLLLLDSGDEIDPSAAETIKTALSVHESICGYLMEQDWGNSNFLNVRLIRNTGVWHYEFPVHEYLSHDPHTCAVQRLDVLVPGDQRIRITQNRSISGLSSPKRWLNDARVLSELLEREPRNARAAFYLGNTYKSLSQVASNRDAKLAYLGKAVVAYERRVDETEDGWHEEKENSMVQLTNALRELQRYDRMRYWALRLYMQYERAEGLLSVARHEIDENDSPENCYVLAALACRAPRPGSKTLFMNWREYDEFRWNLRTHCQKKFTEKNNETRRQTQEPQETAQTTSPTIQSE